MARYISKGTDHLTRTPLQRFEQKYIPEPMSGCWLWLATTNGKGYGMLQFRSKYWLATRVSWTLFRGEIPPDTDLCHICDNSYCVNPDHLYLGNASTNTLDAYHRGRRGIGENQANAILTDAQVLAIRASSRTIRALGKEYGVSPSAISKIRLRKTWRHL